MTDIRGYELPMADLLGGIVFEDGPRRFYPELQLKPQDGRGKGKKVTMNGYYRYQLHPRVKEFGLIFRGSRLFQQYVVTWPEIKRYMAQYPELTPADRADVVCRVFEQKVKDFLSFLKEVKTFGNVSAGPMGYKLVTELMMHGPCGAASPSATYMQEGSCSKHFPKTYNDRTFFDSNGHTHYQRRDTGVHVMKGESKLDNCDVVPYNRALCLAFEAHINVEYCGWSMLIKYLFKYISKGPDRILAKISNSDESTTATGNRPHIDEIHDYVDGRFICPYEACWRIFDFLVHSREPAVQILNVHLENMQRVTFRESDRLDIIVNLPEKKRKTLTEWFVYNNENTDGRHLTYLDFPSEFVCSGDLFYFRMLLCHQKGYKSPIEVCTVNGQIRPTYRATCEALGLLGDDKEWDTSLEDSTILATSKELRILFSQILIYCDVADPLKLWIKYWEAMGDDIPTKISRKTKIPNYHVNTKELQGYILYELEKILTGFGKSVIEFGLQAPPQHLLRDLQSKLLIEEKNYKRDLLREEAAKSVPKLNHDQRKIFDLIISASTTNRQELLFIYGHGGTGKTFLWRTIISSLRSHGKIVLAVASSGIASLLLPAGRTTHSRFKLPLELTDESLCHAKKKSQLGNLLVETDLIIWDEALMNDKRCFETLDRTLRDLMSAPNVVFGGKTIVLGGDFRQTLPVKKGASKEELIVASIVESHLWPHFKVYTLKENMQLLRSGLTTEQKRSSEQFAKWLLDVVTADEEKAIVCPKNVTTNVVNAKILSSIEGQSKTYLSNDEAISLGEETSETEFLYPIEYLNTMTFPELPPRELELKVGSPIMLLRNVNLSGGLCNGTRMIVRSLMSKLIEAQIITGTRIGEKVFIHKIPLTHKDPNLSFTFKRKQFLVKLCYAMKINKTQGQSLSKIDNTYQNQFLAMSYQQTLENQISLRFGKITVFEPLPWKESEFPYHHFKLISYYQLPSRVPYRDENSKLIYPILTDVQLSATPVTHYYINPQTTKAQRVYTVFKEKYNSNPPLQIAKYRCQDLEEEKIRNRQTLHTLLEQNPTTFKGVHFTCEGMITSVQENRDWKYPSCSECSKSLTQQNGTYVCDDHGKQDLVTYRYKFKATVTDGTTTAQFTFFTKAGERITGHPCSQVAQKYKETDEQRFPTEIVNTIGKNHIFQIRYAPSTQ
ncbi:DNA helicase [Tanacetum coccineum]